MIRPPGRDGVVFSERSDGDVRNDAGARSELSNGVGIDDNWATVRQVHGADVLRVDSPGDAGEADGLWTTEVGLPLAIFTADCLGVVLHAERATGVAHAGWRGVDAGVVARLRTEMTGTGHVPHSAEVGPGIGPCCFEVGDEVAMRFPMARGSTSWGTTSVDLVGALATQLDGLDTWTSGSCTMHDAGWFSHRQDGTRERLGTVGWVL
jgi:polyphenol oxidase